MNKEKAGCQHFADFCTITGGGTVCLFHPLTEEARQWLAEHCPLDGEHQYFGDALVIEHRYVASIVEMAIRDGLTPPAAGKESGMSAYIVDRDHILYLVEVRQPTRPLNPTASFAGSRNGKRQGIARR